jgi:1-acyl-sn-glycerol-3-phosphate acyltransferase
MSSDYSKYNFDDIRPYSDAEVPAAVERLATSERLHHAMRYINPDINWDEFAAQLRAVKSIKQFKTTLAYDAVMLIAKATTFSLTISGRSRLPENTPCTFISNHRDIILDAAFLNILLNDIGHGMTKVAIGDNLLIQPWIDTLVRLNNCFIVKRDLAARELLKSSVQLSAYIHHTIKDLKESVWIAQREGRAKDSNDQTQTAVLKMLNLSGEHDAPIRNLISLNIVPIAISYEYDPCDYLKAQEFQLKRDNPDFVKSKRDDLFNMETGLLNNKGRVHFTLCSPVSDSFAALAELNLDKSALFNAIAEIIDKEIYKHYRFYECNYVAYDLLYNSVAFRDHYDLRHKALFEQYLRSQIDKIVIDNKDEVFLRTKILEMYSNPLKNHLETTGHQTT